MTANDLHSLGEVLACDYCEEPVTDDRPQPCEHLQILCADHADECRWCREDAVLSRWAEDAADEQREAS